MLLIGPMYAGIFLGFYVVYVISQTINSMENSEPFAILYLMNLSFGLICAPKGEGMGFVF